MMISMIFFERFVEAEQEEVNERFRNRMDSLDIEERYENALFIYFEEFNEENKEQIERLREDISLIPEWEFLEKYDELLQSLEFLLSGLLNQARVELPRKIGDEEFISDKLLEELLVSLHGFRQGVSQEDPELILDSGNVSLNLIYSLMKYKEDQFDLEDICIDILESSKRLKAIGLENEVSQKILGEFYDEDNFEIEEFKDRLRLERSFVIYKDQRVNLSVSRAAEMSGYRHRNFLEEAKKYNIILKDA